jgi:TolB-like protein
MHILKQLFLSVLFSISAVSVFSQDFDKKINDAATEIATKITATGKQNVAIVEFDNLDGSQSQLGVFLADEIASSLAMQSANQTKFTVLERANLDLILQEKKILKSFDRSKLAKDLGKINAAEILISATITEFNGYYRLNIKLLDTKTGNSLNSSKISFVQEPSLKELHKQIVEKSDYETPKKSYQEENTYQPKPIEQKPVYIAPATTTEVCFNNTGPTYDYQSGYNAVVVLKNPNTSEKIKTVDVLCRQKACVYNIANGIYQIEISWYHQSDSKDRIKRVDSREINVKSGSENNIEIKFQQ